MGSRIAITGAGIISSIGAGKAGTLQSLVQNRRGIGPLRHLQTVHDLPCGEVQMSDNELRSELHVPENKALARTTMLGIYAVREAMMQADVSSADFLISGTTVGGMDITEKEFLKVQLSGDVNELLRLHTCGKSTGDIADYFGGFKSLTTTSTACSSAANSIVLGARLIRAGKAGIVVAGGAECLTRYHLNGFNSLMILDSEPCRPFDASRAGLNLGEGAGFLVLESQEHAEARGAEPIGFVDGYGNACDAFHQTASSPEGDGAFSAMKAAISMAGLQSADIDYVNAHGTGTVNNDESESFALKRVFGEKMPPVSSTKCFTGHTTSASGSIESVICLLAMQNRFIPANLGWTTPFEGGIIPEACGRKGVELNHVLSNAFAFGGNDTSILFSRI